MLKVTVEVIIDLPVSQIKGIMRMVMDDIIPKFPTEYLKYADVAVEGYE